MRNGGQGIVQICHVVEDLDAAITQWVAEFNAGPFFVQQHLLVPVDYRGAPGMIDINVALGQCGAVQVELIEVASEDPSVYRDMFPDGKPAGGSGFHHVAIFVDDFEQALADYRAGGCEIGAVGQFNGAGFAYVDTRARVGFFTELYEESPFMRKFYKNIAAAAMGWDGSNPQRPLADVAA